MLFPPTSHFVSSLPIQAVFSAVFLLAFLSYKIAWIVSSILISNLIISTKEKNAIRRLARWGLIGKFAGFIVLIISTIIKIGTALVQTILLVFYSLVPFIVLACVLVIIQDRWGDSAMMVTSVLNDPESPVSQSINYLIRVPLKVLDDIAFYVIPAYNFIVFVFIHIPIEFFANFIFGEGATLVMKGISLFAQSISLMVQAISQYIKDNHMVCPELEPMCWNSTADLSTTQCVPIDKPVIAALCLDSNSRRLDAMPFLTAMMHGVTCFLKALAMGCESVENVINIFFFPFTDLSLWKALDGIINGLLFVIVGAPTATSARCSLGGGFSSRPALCTPDFAPAFDFVIGAVYSLGDLIDNFFDMIYLLVVYGKNAECPGGRLTQHSLYLPIWKDPFIQSLFGSNSTVLVTLSSVLFALTDGQHSVYISHKKNVERSYFPNAWGSTGAVNPRFGIARVYDKSGEISMLGCRCLDTLEKGMVVQCSTSVSGVQSSTSTTYNSTWEVRESGQFMQCSSVRIIVQSIRWPEQRVILSEKKYSEQKLSGDAAVYVIPTCGGESNTLSCLDSRIFTLSNCYPFCMALHTSNIGIHPLLFRGFSSWMNGVLLSARDCVPMGSIVNRGSGESVSSCSSDTSSTNPTIEASAQSASSIFSCNYNPICSSWMTNKTDFYQSSFQDNYPSSIPSFADTTQFVKHVLDGQPLVVAGGMFMRVSEISTPSSQTERFVDFPVLIGRNNEFFMEVASPAGIPVVPVPSVLGLSIASEKKGFISLPPRYIEMVDVHNPATLSMNALWYAVNPSYDWLSCFAKYCATEGRDTCVQLVFSSSYTPIRLWKVLYKSSACFIRAEDGKHFCRDDVAQGFPLDPSLDLPPMGSDEFGRQISSLCSNNEFNLWVESMEYFDELNVAVTVRRGSVKALHNLMQRVLSNSPKTASNITKSSQWYRIKEEVLGRTVVYFVNTQNISLVRPLEPWTSINGEDPGFLSVVHGSAVLCPELRFLPSIGSFFSHSLAAFLLGVKMPVNLLSNLFAVIEMLNARSLHACPADGLGHSAIEKCGMTLFDLTAFFSVLAEANKAFWNILAWLASLFHSQSEGSVAVKYFESFITGVSVYGEAGKIVSLFQVSEIAENLLDTGIQDNILGRRLLSYEDRCSNNSSGACRGRKLLGMKQIAKSAGRSAISGIFSVFTGGVQTIFSISQSLSGAMSGSMSSVDFGILLSTMNPTYILGSAVTAPGIAWAQFTYETILPIALDLTSTVMYAKKLPKSTAIVWVHLHAAKDNYEKLIMPKMTQGCTGLRLMLGYSGGLPTAIYHNCISASHMHHAFFTLSTLVFAEFPFYSCMCVQSSGQPIPDFIIANCMEWVPYARKGLWQSIIVENGQNAQKLCKWYGDYLHETAMHVFDSWTEESHSAATSLASFLQDLIVPEAKEMGTCVNTHSNPSIFVMLPIPSEHYHICGKTSDCRLRCADSFAMFEYEANRYQRLGYSPGKPFQSMEVSVESPFFNMYQSTSNSLYYIKDRILAISARNNTSSIACTTCAEGGCLIVATAAWDVISSVSVTTYCTPPPSALKATVFAAGGGTWLFSTPAPTDLHFSLTYCNFALQGEDIYVLMAYSSAVMSVSSSGIFSFDSSSSAEKRRAQQQLYVAYYDFQDKYHAKEQALLTLLLDTEAMSASLLSPAIQDYVFENIKVYNAYVKDCRINELVEISSGIKGKLVFFMRVMFTAQGWVKQEDMTSDAMGFINDEQKQGNQKLMKSGYVTAVLTWHDPIAFRQEKADKHLDYFLPCVCDGEESSNLCPTPSFILGCRPDVEAALYLAQRGTFLHASGYTYLYLPNANALGSNGKKMAAQYVEIHPDGFNTTYPFKAPHPGLQYPNHGINQPMKLYTPTSVTKEQLMRQELGFWSHSDVFTLSGLSMRVLRSPVLLNSFAVPIRWLQATQSTATTVQWLQEARINRTNRGFELLSMASQQTKSTAKVQTKCSPYDCASCVSASVRLACHALQDCMLSRCIGTTVNYKNILCSIGVVVQQLYMQMVTSWRAIYLFMVEIGMFVLNGFGGSLSQKIVLSFPTDIFYSLICACKDVFASFIAMAMSVVENVRGLFTTGKIDLSNNNLAPHDAVFTVQVRAIGGLIFNIVSDATLYPILALHRWILCITNSDVVSEGLSATISVQFGDLTMDQSWGVCSPLSDKLSLLMDVSELESLVQDDVNGFLSFSMSLLSGIGDTVLYGMILFYDSIIAFLECIVWNIQNMMEAFNLRSCKLTDYMQRVVLQCACGDTPYYIPDKQRGDKWMDGALWCSGALAITLTDGTQGVIFNPYSLQELSDGLIGVTEYIQCLASSPSTQSCKKTYGENSLSALTIQGVEPIAVWTKCKTNYIQQSWDIAAGALFSEDIVATAMSGEVSDAVRRREAQAWARRIAPEFLSCLQSPQRFYQDYSVCLTMFLNLTTGRLPNAYFSFTSQSDLMSTKKEPPDACMVFTGLNATSSPPLQTIMHHCLMDQVDTSSDPQKCPYNPSVWSLSDPGKLPVAKLFSIVGQVQPSTPSFYQTAIEKLQKAFEKFNQTFAKTAQKIQVALFSADGDFIHDFIDCVFLGPYTRVDMLPCDKEGVLDCPFYARDENGGMHRNFTPCFGEVMQEDRELPFTCGSQTRRALIKYFFRSFAWSSHENGQDLDSQLISLMQERIMQLMMNHTQPISFGCLNETSGRCEGRACTKENGYKPCLDMEFAISAVNVSKFMLKELLLRVDAYYTKVMHDTSPWTTFYNVSGSKPLPAQWGKEAGASRAVEAGLFQPTKPVIRYDESEVYSMPSHDEPAQARFEGSVWSLCMGLISQGQMSLAMDKFGDDWRPLGANDAFLRSMDWYNLENVASAIRNLTKVAAEKSPFVWHKSRFHAPSQSAMCKTSRYSKQEGGARLRFSPVEFDVPDVSNINIFKTLQVPSPHEKELSIPFHGFAWGLIGNAHELCLCGQDHAILASDCTFSPDFCTSLPNTTRIPCVNQLKSVCTVSRGQYAKTLLPEIWRCLHEFLPGARCPELGPSDSWGLFPMDCDGKKCYSANRWTGNAQQDMIFEGIRLVTEGRSGLKLSNIVHVNSTFHETIDYTQQAHPASYYQIQRCFSVENLAKDQFEDSSHDALQNWIHGLFPAAQMHHDSPVVAYCSRFVIEVARAEALSFVSLEASLEALQQAKMWQQKCHSKVKHLASCARLGVYYDVPPPPLWKTSFTKHCDVTLDSYSWDKSTGIFLTPWCIAVDQEKRVMYDARLCLRNSMSPSERQSLADGDPILKSLQTSDLTPSCRLTIQPLELLHSQDKTPPLSSLFTSGAERISHEDVVELSLQFDELFVQRYGGVVDIRNDPISHVLDWWPEVPTRLGFHVTSPMIEEELAPIAFDTHYGFHNSSLHYMHSALRNQTLLTQTSGSGGLCRAHSVGMPIFETNTNRICTRMPKKGVFDAPHLPVDAPKTEANVPPMGPYSSFILEENFEEQQCALDYEDVPWPKSKNANDFAGSIPGISNYLLMEESGRAQYVGGAHFPPRDAVLLPLKGMYKDWGKCADVIVWDDSPPCSEQRGNSDCPRNTLCLKRGLNETGICFSTAAFRAQNTRPPCFRTDHCSDGLVCLADGGCSPLFLHMWNDPKAQIESLEFALMADDCGFHNPRHPFTQTLRGVSPWEQVPDLLHMHGLCSHRNWFAYRNALKDGVCTEGDDTLECNMSTAEWPDVQMRFDRCRISSLPSAARYTMGQQYALHLVPHPCDMEYMHASIQKQRLKICSGYQGIQKGTTPGNYMTYDLGADGTWGGAIAELLISPATVHWMRTYSESTNILNLGNIFFNGQERPKEMSDIRLGFLGAETNDSEPILSDLAKQDAIRFFRCTDKTACQMPEYSYGGVYKERRLNLATSELIANYSELSLRRCGAIGSLLSEGNVCRLDAELFPLFSYLLKKTEDIVFMAEEGDMGSRPVFRGCSAIWHPTILANTRVIIRDFDLNNWHAVLTENFVQSFPSALFCSSKESTLLCIYWARPSSVLSEENRKDAVSQITNFLNSLFQDTTRLVRDAVNAWGVLSTYESINLCSSEVLSYTHQIQALIQNRYNSSITSGFYMAFQLSLYEFPQQWFHQCMLSILLSYVDASIPQPDTSFMASPISIPLPFWSTLGHLNFCSENFIRQKSGLYFMLCKGKHADYTFRKSDNDLLNALLRIVKEGIMEIAHAQLYENQGEASIECFTQAKWNCNGAHSTDNPQCSLALLQYYDADRCGREEEPPALCESDFVTYSFADLKTRTLKEMSLVSQTTKNLESFLTSSTKSIVGQADKQIEKNDYIMDTENSDSYVTLATVRGIDTSLFAGFTNTTEWLHQTCQSAINPSACGESQEALTDKNPCLFKAEYQYEDTDRYFSNNVEPVIIIQLANGENFRVEICELNLKVTSYKSSAIITQFDLKKDLILDDGPTIIRVQAPPGVLMKAYTTDIEISMNEWETARFANSLPRGLSNCAWSRNPDEDTWWPNAVGAALLSNIGGGFDQYEIIFEDMTSSWHTGSSKFLWESQGCGRLSSVYALEIWLESPVFTQLSSAFCSYATSYPITQEGYYQRKPRCNGDTVPFRVANALPSSSKQYALWRCMPCTRFNPQIASDGFFGCTLPGRVPMDNLFTSVMLQKTFPFLYSENALLEFVREKLSLTSSFSITTAYDASRGFIKIMVPVKENVISTHLEGWSFSDGYDATPTLNNERKTWTEAINNPGSLFTMECEGQKYTVSMQQKCNPKVNKKLQGLSNFVEKQYRQKNGVWLQTVSKGKGVAWKANVAHSAVGKFTLFYTSGDRPSEQVLSKWILGDGPCSQQSPLDDRICIESKRQNIPFEPLHPWVGGDFNPFAGNNGLDECPYILSASCVEGGRTDGSSTTLVSMCPCECTPSWACKGKNFNYSEHFMRLEFPKDEACLMQKFRDTSVMQQNDPSNLCSAVRQTVPTSRGCLFPHGLLGGVRGGETTVTKMDLHSAQGTSSLMAESKPQEMIESYSVEELTKEPSSLWSGQKLPTFSNTIPFLRMPRDFLHPSHIAFGIDTTVSSLPLIIKAISLLPGNNFSEKSSADWVQTLKAQWVYELYTGIENNPEVQSISSLYPQLSIHKSGHGKGDWSCPIRKYAFLAGNDNAFGPLTPNPISAHAIFGMRGVHPFLKTQGPYPNLAPYYTTNGACFYHEDSLLWPQINIEDVENPCGLRGMLHLLVSQQESLMSVQESFGKRCNDIIDTPDVGGKLRSGETLAPVSGMKQKCGILHRIAPGLISTKGNQASIRRTPLTTMSAGGDCHMGRVFRMDPNIFQGQRCSIIKSEGVNYKAICGHIKQDITRVRPLSLEELIDKNRVMYRGDLNFKTSKQIHPSFIGPVGEGTASHDEISFGLLYSASLKEMLASDLIHVCRQTPECVLDEDKPWAGDNFMQDYLNGSLSTSPAGKKITASNAETRLNSLALAQLSSIDKEVALWNQTDWTWSFLDRTPRGNLNKSKWLRNRTEACSSSFEELLQVTPGEFIKDSVRRITLCAPPPTGEMGELCTALTQHQKDIVQKNCQLWGKGDCISNAGMFYLPYMWSSTNNEYAYSRVSNFYEEIIQKSGASYEKICITDNTILSTLAALSRQQNSICPASTLEVFKEMLVSLKRAGHDLLYLAYNQIMMIANIIASVFTIIQGKDGSFYLQTAMQYMMQLFALIAKLLVSLLDIIVELMSTISPIGNMMKEILNILCIAYNWIMKEIIINVWCGFTRPTVIVTLKVVQALAFISSQVVDLLQKVIDYIGDGTTETCIAYYNANAITKCPGENIQVANLSEFQPKPMATLCWANEEGGGIFTGVTQSLLSCTSSDTCAKDPLSFDDVSKEGLIYCGSCPSVADSQSTIRGFRFGCDTYLQRCVCTIVDNTKSACLKNSDCSIPQDAMCGVASELDAIRGSYISVPCGTCGGMGMDPICMIDAKESYGVCGCANVKNGLLTCTEDQVGKPALALYSTKFCATILDDSIKTLISETIYTQSIHLDFSQIAVVACSLSSQQALCMEVAMPFGWSKGDMPLVVLLQLLSIVRVGDGGGRRRLLSSTDLLGHVHAAHDNLSQPLFNEWVNIVLSDDIDLHCDHRGLHRDEMKQCLQSLALAKYVVHHFNLSEIKGKEYDLASIHEDRILTALWKLRMYANQDGLFPFLMDLNPFFKTLRRVWHELTPKNMSFHSLLIDEGGKGSTGSRKLLSTVTTYPVEVDWSFNCTSLQKPLNKIISAFWNTVHYYEKGQDKVTNGSNTNMNCTKDLGFTACMSYSLPSSNNAPKAEESFWFQTMSNLIFYAPTFGMGGDRVFDALLSPMDYEEAVHGEFITGKRILYDMASCNYTQITLGGTGKNRNFFVIFIVLVVLFQIIATMCMPLSCCQTAMWVFLFPAIFFWAMYNTSPLCWPMIPTNFVHDVYMEVTYFLPQEFKVPKFLVKPHCTLDGKLEDGSYDSSCFSKCSDPPFLFVSWQDSLAWWICEASTDYCAGMGEYLSVFGSLFKDMISSSDYYASVINYSSSDTEFVQAHRLCAFFSFYQVMFLMITIIITCYLAPTVLMGILEVFMGCAILLMDTYIADG